VLVHALLGLAIPYSLIPTNATKFELTHALKLTQPTSLFVNSRHLPLALAVAKEIGIAPERIYIFEGRVRGKTSLDGIVERVQKSSASPVDVKLVPKTHLAYLVFSSGTTGLPKGRLLFSSIHEVKADRLLLLAVMITHENLIYSMLQYFTTAMVSLQVYTVCAPFSIRSLILLRQILQPPAVTRKEGIPASLAFLPFYHSYGLHAHCFRPFAAPSTHVIIKKWSVERALKIIEKSVPLYSGVWL
jgi:acyl-CoA synthetase (AMP-forming)/AMP-acid ligase II